LSRRRKLLVVAVLVGATALYALWRSADWGARLVEHLLAGYFHRPVQVAALRLNTSHLEVELHGLRIAGITPEAEPFIEAPLVRIRPSLAPVRFNHLVFSRVRIEGLRLRINAFPDPPAGPGGDDIPKLGGPARGGMQIGIERLVVVGGEFVLDHARVPLEIDLPGFRGRLASRRQGGMAGHFSFRPGWLRVGSAPAVPVGTEIDMVFHRGVLTVAGARLQAENTNVTYHGRLRFSGRPQGQLQMEGAIDLAVLERHVFRSGLGFAGAAHWNGLLSVDGSRLRIEGRMNGANGHFMGVPVPRFAGAIAYDGQNGVVIRDLDLSTLGGSGQLAVDVPPSSTRRPIRIAGSMRDADGEGLLRMIFGWGELRIGTAATGTLDVSWPHGKPRAISGRLGVDLAERADGRFAVAGRLDWSALAGLQSYERLELQGQGMRGRVTGEVDATENADLAVEGQTADIAATDALLMRVRRALGSPEAQLAGFSGSGSFRGHWGGTLSWPLLEGRLSGVHVGYVGVDWGRAEWSGSYDSAREAIVSRSLVLRKDGGEIWWDGRNEIGWLGLRDAMRGRVRLSSWPVADIVRFMEWRIVASGRASGEATVGGRRSAPQGEARVTVRDGRYFSVPFESAEIASRWNARVAEVVSGELGLGGGRASFRGTLDDQGVYDGSGEMEGVDLGALLPASASGTAYSGRLSGRLVMQGTLSRPRLRVSLRSPRLFVGDEGIGSLELKVVGTGDERVTLDGRCQSARVDLTLGGAVGTTAPYQAALTLEARSTSLDPFLRVVQPDLPATVAVIASGSVRIGGPLETPAALSAEASLSSLELLLPEFAVRAREPVRVSYSDGRLDLERFHLAGEGTDLELAGVADLVGDGPLALSARGRADLHGLSALTRRIQGTGVARLSADLTGSRSAPHLVGSLDLEGAGLRVRGFPHGIEGLHGRVRFTESGAELEDVSGTLAGGDLQIEGQAAYSRGRLTSYDIRPVGRGLALRYPEGMRSLLDAQLRLFGDGERQWITGTIDVRQALYNRRYDVASELLGVGHAAAPREAASLETGAQLDLRVRAPGTLRLDNNLATLAARADLRIQGTSRAPIVTGRAEIERGRLYFQGRTYVIQRGTIDFVNPQRLDPLFDIEAETRIHAYRVTLRVSGTLERVIPTLTSDPPLSSLQILALLAGQDESEVVNLTQAQARERQGGLAATGAATLAAGRLSESVGLEREAERLFGLNRFSIDPTLLRGAGTTPTARVTVGKRLGSDLNVLYSQDLRGIEERILAVEYTLSDRLSLLLTRTDPGSAKTGVEQGWAFDVRIRQSHR
jgi:hypothetical protein